MNKNLDFERFCNALGTLAEVFDKELSEIAIAAYFKTLQAYSIENIENAISKAMASLKFWPKPVELIEIITGGSAQDLEDRSMLQATEVLNAIRSVGSYQSVSFPDQITNAVIHQGFNGWAKLCEMQESETKWFLKDFARLYQVYAREGIKRTKHLPGQFERDNAARGFEIDPPVLIGTKEELRQLPN